MYLWVDDIRIPPCDDWVWVRSVSEAITAIKCYDRSFTSDILYISLDHDAGDFAGGGVMNTLQHTKEQKTRQSVFLEQWPNAETRSNGVLDIKPCSVEKYMVCCKCCTECYQNFWLQEVE